MLDKFKSYPTSTKVLLIFAGVVVLAAIGLGIGCLVTM